MVGGRVILRNEETKDLVVLQMRFFPMKSRLHRGQNDVGSHLLRNEILPDKIGALSGSSEWQ